MEEQIRLAHKYFKRFDIVTFSGDNGIPKTEWVVDQIVIITTEADLSSEDNFINLLMYKIDEPVERNHKVNKHIGHVRHSERFIRENKLKKLLA